MEKQMLHIGTKVCLLPTSGPPQRVGVITLFVDLTEKLTGDESVGFLMSGQVVDEIDQQVVLQQPSGSYFPVGSVCHRQVDEFCDLAVVKINSDLIDVVNSCKNEIEGRPLAYSQVVPTTLRPVICLLLEKKIFGGILENDETPSSYPRKIMCHFGVIQPVKPGDIGALCLVKKNGYYVPIASLYGLYGPHVLFTPIQHHFDHVSGQKYSLYSWQQRGPMAPDNESSASNKQVLCNPTPHKILQDHHTREVFSVAFSPDSKLIASASRETVCLWNLPSCELNAELKGHTNYVYSVAFSPDGKSIVTGSDHTVRTWSIATKQQITTLNGHSSYVFSVAWSPIGDLIASGSQDKTVILWDATSGSAKKTLTGHTSTVWNVSFSQNGNKLASGGNDNTAIIWDVHSGAALINLAHSSIVSSVCFSHDDQFIVTGCGDKIVHMFNANTGREEKRFEGHTSHVRSVAISCDGSIIASGSSDNSVRLWDVASTKQLQKLGGHTNLVNTVAFSRDGKFIASGSADKTVCLWNAPSSLQRQILPSTVSPKTNKRGTEQQMQQEAAAVSVTDPTVAIMTALELELFPFLKWVDPIIHENRGGFTYLTGLLGKTKVVLVQLPSGQTGNAAATAYGSKLLEVFPSIDVLIFCGIAGGLPPHVHLGDVVVSSGQAGVIQWDFKRWIEGDVNFERTGRYSHLPSAEWLTTVTALLQMQRIPSFKAAFQKTISDFVAEESSYARPDVAADVVFRSDFVHSDMKKSCQELGCFDNTDNFRVAGEAELKVVQGSIASGNGVMKSAKMRDALAKMYQNENLLAIEMESAGAAFAAYFKHKKYLFIRGICDYADSHKNKQWQNYAALAAAAVVRHLIEMRQQA